MPSKAITAQRDFSAGEIDVTLKRDEDDAIFKTGLRTCANFRILDTKKIANRIGRSALFLSGQRVERVLMSPGNVFSLDFSAATLTVRNSAGASVFTQGGFPWTALNVGSIVWDIYGLNIYIAFPGMRPQVLTWDGVSVWSIAAYTEQITGSGQKRTPFYRLSPQGVTMQPSATVGSVTLTFSQGIAVAGMVGTRMRFCGKQLLITAFVDTSHLTASVVEPLPPGQTMTIGSTVGIFNVGDVIIGATSGATGIVTASPSQQTVASSTGSGVVSIGQLLTGGTSGATGIITNITTFGITVLQVALSTSTLFTNSETVTTSTGSLTNVTVSSATLTAQLLQNTNGLVKSFLNGEVIAGPSGQATITGVPTTVGPQAVSVWDDEVMNTFRGFPSSVTVDQGRLALMNFPALSNAISYSAIGNFIDLYVPTNGLTAANAIFELAPGKSQILFMAPGMEGSEFIFCDNAIYYFPITLAQPLSATTGVAFNLLTKDGCAGVQPRLVLETMVYVSAGGSTMRAITATGAYQRPYEVRPISQLHDHLFKSPVAIAAPSATDPNFPERYLYVLNSDGTLAQGKLKVQDGQIQGAIGWVPMSGVGAVKWVAARAADVVFTTTYAPGGATPTTIAEINDATQYLDGAILYNSVPAALTPPGGKGPLFTLGLANGTATVMDVGTRQLGLYNVDANGFLMPQFEDGENLTSSQLIVGQAWTATAEPFAPSAQPGQDIGQRTSRRRIARFAVNFQNSTGFQMARLFSGPLKPGGPALGTIMNFFRVTTYNQGDDPTQAPPLREGMERWRPSGRSYDPRAAVIKDTPGPLNILELDLECTV